MNGCGCPVPRPRQPNPNFPTRDKSCSACGKLINQSFVSSDERFDEFFDQLMQLPGTDPGFVEHCRDRETRGRDVFGLLYLDRDNPREAMEEACDLAIYCYLHILRKRREGVEVDRTQVLEAAQLAAKAWSILGRM